MASSLSLSAHPPNHHPPGDRTKAASIVLTDDTRPLLTYTDSSTTVKTALQRTPSAPLQNAHPKRQGGGRAHRPALNRKSTPQSILKLGGARDRVLDKGQDDRNDNDDDEKMATSFLQYCAMCEKQILVPNNSILYCSESCRRKDSVKPASAIFVGDRPASFPPPHPNDPLYSPPLYSKRARDIVRPASPTSPTKISPFRNSGDFENSPPDHSGAEFPSVKPGDRNTSTSSLSNGRDYRLASSTPHHRSSNISYSSPFATPALTPGPTPTTPPFTSFSSYTNSTRPLPPRHNPQFSSSGSSPRSISLVTPFNYNYHQHSTVSISPGLDSKLHLANANGTKRGSNNNNNNNNHNVKSNKSDGDLIYEKRWTLSNISGVAPSGVVEGGGCTKSTSSVAIDGSTGGQRHSGSTFSASSGNSQGALGRLLMAADQKQQPQQQKAQ
ncbi:MAG: hypothetical protein M1837_004996 [Sclerophora amabilis]|nr:MAG: hypothetical protein M1837_004996 [Sclerophora amabilis]